MRFGSNLDDPSLWTKQRRELANWLDDRAPSFTDGYVAAVQLLNTSFPARVHLICHLVRDIYRYLPAALEAQPTQRPAEVFPSMVQTLVERWDEFPPKGSPVPTMAGSDRVVSAQVHKYLLKIIDKSKKLTDQPTVGKHLAIALFRTLDAKDETFIHPWIIEAFDEEYKFFVRRAHLARSMDRVPTDDGLVKHFEAFERAFHSLVGPYFSGKEELDVILKDTGHHNVPTELQIESALQRMRSRDFAAYFLSRLENPRWIGPLRSHGLFTSPPPPIATADGTRFPRWPASQYLIRMAKHSPNEVAEVFRAMKTDNASIISDTLDAALEMPADVSATMVPTIADALARGTIWLEFADGSDLCVHLANGGQHREAMLLAQALFAPRLNNDNKPGSTDTYWYKDGLTKVVPALLQQEPQTLLVNLCGWLNQTVMMKSPSSSDSVSDYSYLWRPAIEEHEQNRNYDRGSILVGFVREAFEQAIREARLSLPKSLELLGTYSYPIFKRLRIHLIAQFADQNSDLAQETILDQELFDDHRFKHEYARLLGLRLDLLSQTQRDLWFSWVDAGPNLEAFEENFRRQFERAPTDEDRMQRVRYWQFQKLHWIRSHLTGDKKTFYELMRKAHGEPQMADLNIRVGPARWGDESPMTVEQLSAMPFVSVLDAVSSWKQGSPSLSGPTVGGLASTFEQYVAKDPQSLAANADSLIGRPPLYVRGFIRQMSKAIKDGRDIEIQSVLKLCQWVVEGDMATLLGAHRDVADRDFQSTRDEISAFIETACAARQQEAPRYPMSGLRVPLWQIIARLSRDPADSYLVDDSSERDARFHDFLMQGMNSPQGKAIEAALEYARWVANHLMTTDKRVAGGFDIMPEVRDLLEWLITPPNSSVGTSAILGSHTHLIHWIDAGWLQKNLSVIFNIGSLDTLQHSLARSAWNAFLVWVPPHEQYYHLLRAQFAHATEEAIGLTVAIDTNDDHPLCRLGQHLMILYARGQLTLDDDNALLRKFIERGNPDMRRYAMTFAGHSLGGDVPADVIERFKTLWDLYWKGPGKSDAAEKPQTSLLAHGLPHATSQRIGHWSDSNSLSRL